MIGSSRCLRPLWLLGVNTLELVFPLSFENRSMKGTIVVIIIIIAVVIIINIINIIIIIIINGVTTVILLNVSPGSTRLFIDPLANMF